MINNVTLAETNDELPLALIVDSATTAGYTYICEALPGTLSSAAGWRIQKITDATGTTVWADGNAKFDNVADNRASLTYS
jgi:hypothetical protein